MSKQIQKKTDAPLATTAVTQTGTISNAEAEDYELPGLHLFQDVGKEAELYGEHPKGSWINSQSQTALEGNPVVVPVIGTKSIEAWWAMGSARGKGFVGRWDSRAEIPDDVKSEHEVVIYDVITYIVLVAGEDFPFAIRFKSTSLRVGRTLNSMEMARAAMGKPRGRYLLDRRAVSNDKGKWFAPMLKPQGNATDEEARMAETFAAFIDPDRVSVIGEEDRDDLPI